VMLWTSQVVLLEVHLSACVEVLACPEVLRAQGVEKPE
ncbi:unnamed protein product, partial [Acidithrix sp. C25]